jgi:hypothetical protein
MGGAESGPGTFLEASEGVSTFSLPLSRDPLLIIRRRLWVVLFTAVVLTGLAVILSLIQTPMYEASVTILVGQERRITDTPNDVVGLQQLTQTMVGGGEQPSRGQGRDPPARLTDDHRGVPRGAPERGASAQHPVDRGAL